MPIDKGITVYVVFPVHNRIDSTERFMESLARQTVSNYRVVICDDGSTDGTGEFLATYYPDVIVLNGNGNLWWTAGINRCVEYVLSHCKQSDYVLTLNNDALLPEKYIEQKLERAAEHPNTIIGSLCVYANDVDHIETSGYIIDFDKPKLHHLTKPGDVRTKRHIGVTEVTHLPGKGVLFPVKVFRELGLYDEANLPQYHADTDFVLSAYKAGYKVLLDFDSIVLSEVNMNNMTLPTQEVTLKGIMRTFCGPYSINSFRAYNYLAKKHFPKKRVKFLAGAYVKIIGGQIKRYLKYRFSVWKTES